MRCHADRGHQHSQSPFAGFQAHLRLFGLAEGFSAYGLSENKTHGPCRRNRQWCRPDVPHPAVNETYLAIVNPAAGGGRCRRLVGPAMERLRAGGLKLEEVETSCVGDATRLASDYYARGYRRFIAVGGDGTSYEIVNGLF